MEDGLDIRQTHKEDYIYTGEMQASSFPSPRVNVAQKSNATVFIQHNSLHSWLVLCHRCVFVLSMCLQESVDKTYLFECVMALPVDMERMRASLSHSASQCDTDGGPDEAAGVTVQQVLRTGALADRPAKGMWADNKQSKANYFRKISVPESAAMTDL